MKVFISWSGKKSHEIALSFHEWIQGVLQNIEPYISSEDISKGSYWSDSLKNELKDAGFGVIFVTKDNKTEPWVLYEAGALSNALGSGRVSPVLVDIEIEDVPSPLIQFQSTSFSREDVHKLLKSINESTNEPLRADVLTRTFDKWWSEFESVWNQILEKNITIEKHVEKDEPKELEMLREILSHSRAISQTVSSPRKILPERHVRSVVEGLRRNLLPVFLEDALEAIDAAADDIEFVCMSIDDKNEDEISEIQGYLGDIKNEIQQIEGFYSKGKKTDEINQTDLF